MASLYVKDGEANELAERLARRRGVTKTAAVKIALIGELARDDDRSAGRRPARKVLEQFWRDFPPPGAGTPVIDKSFYDWLSGEDDR